MKRLLLSLVLLVGCSQKEPKQLSPMDHFMSQNGKAKILSTTGIVDDLVGQIGGDYIDHISLITGELDPHSYELVKGDDEKMDFAQLIFFSGLGLEHGASLQYRLQHHPKAVSLGGAIVAQNPDALLKVDAVADPHIWMDISLWAQAIDPIVEALSQLDKDHADQFKQNAEIVRANMLSTDEKIKNWMIQVPAEKRYLVTSHDAFNYFTRRYLSAHSEEEWQPRFAAPEGLSPEGQLSTSHIAQIIDHLSRYQIHVVFPESNVSRDSLKKIAMACQEKGLPVKISQEVLYGDAMGAKGSGADSYLSMMTHNAEVMVKELK